MFTRHEPLVSFHPKLTTLQLIKNELQTFGLNPSDWREETSPHGRRTGLILVHREDCEVRLAVKVRNVAESSAIEEVEWLIS